MYIGRKQLGEDLLVAVTTVDSNKTPTWPDEAPYLEIYKDGSSTATGSTRLSPTERYRTTGAFDVTVPLGFGYSEGMYLALVRYQLSSVRYQIPHIFEIIPGGSSNGQVLTLREYRKAGGNFILQHRSSGQIAYQSNPQVE